MHRRPTQLISVAGTSFTPPVVDEEDDYKDRSSPLSRIRPWRRILLGFPACHNFCWKLSFPLILLPLLFMLIWRATRLDNDVPNDDPLLSLGVKLESRLRTIVFHFATSESELGAEGWLAAD